MATLRELHDDPAFMTCVLRVDYQTRRWQKAVREVLRSSDGVRSFRMDEYGIVEVSGVVHPSLLIKRLGKAGRGAQVCWFQFGQCSSNLFLPHQNSHCYSYDVADGRIFPFREGGYGGSHHHYPRGYEYDHDMYYRPASATRRPAYRGETVSCCCVM